MQKFYVYSKYNRDQVKFVLGEKETPTLLRIGNQKRRQKMENDNAKAFETFQEAKEHGMKFLQDWIDELQRILNQRKKDLENLKNFEETDCTKSDMIW